MIARLDPWISAFRPPAQINLALPMLVGLSQRTPCDSRFDGLSLAQALLISLLLQAMILYANEASDATTDDAAARTLISGGAGIGATGALSSGQLRGAAIVAGMLGLVVCATLGGAPMAGLWLLAVALVWAYDGQMFRLSRHPLGSVCQGLGVGVIVPMLGAGTQAAWPSTLDLLIGIGLGLAGHILTALPDEASDTRVGKRTVVVWWGGRNAFALMLALLTLVAFLLLNGGASRPCAELAAVGGVDYMIASVIGGGLAAAGILARRRFAATIPTASGASGVGRGHGTMVRAGPIPADLWVTGLVASVLWLVWALR